VKYGFLFSIQAGNREEEPVLPKHHGSCPFTDRDASARSADNISGEHLSPCWRSDPVLSGLMRVGPNRGCCASQTEVESIADNCRCCLAAPYPSSIELGWAEKAVAHSTTIMKSPADDEQIAWYIDHSLPVQWVAWWLALPQDTDAYSELRHVLFDETEQLRELTAQDVRQSVLRCVLKSEELRTRISAEYNQVLDQVVDQMAAEGRFLADNE